MIRSGDAQAWLRVGPAVRYLLRFDGAALAQEVAPFTWIQVEAGYETEDGLWSARAEAAGGLSYLVGEAGAVRGRAEVYAQRVLIALNDQPVQLRAGFFGVLADAGVRGRSEWGSTVSLLARFGG